VHLISCGLYDDYVARKHLHPDTMKIILFEFYLADEINTSRLLNDQSLNRESENLSYYNKILDNHHVSSEKFFSSLNYFMQRPKLFSALTDSLNSYAQKKVAEELSAPYKK
jgi:hypothetical protein